MRNRGSSTFVVYDVNDFRLFRSMLQEHNTTLTREINHYIKTAVAEGRVHTGA